MGDGSDNAADVSQSNDASSELRPFSNWNGICADAELAAAVFSGTGLPAWNYLSGAGFTIYDGEVQIDEKSAGSQSDAQN